MANARLFELARAARGAVLFCLVVAAAACSGDDKGKLGSGVSTDAGAVQQPSAAGKDAADDEGGRPASSGRGGGGAAGAGGKRGQAGRAGSAAADGGGGGEQGDGADAGCAPPAGGDQQAAADGGGSGRANGCAAADGGSTGSAACKPWPAAAAGASEEVGATIKVTGAYDGKLKRYIGVGDLGNGDQSEGQDPLFELADGATLENVVIGAPAADGVHCLGSCTLRNVWWEDVGEDAATFVGSAPEQTMTIDCAGAREATDKVLQHNGPGTMVVRHFFAETFGKLYRSCGNCKKQYTRHVEFSDIDAKSGKLALAGINSNYDDTARFQRVTVHDDPKMKLSICDRYVGNDQGDEPSKEGSGPDATHCLYRDSDISWQP